MSITINGTGTITGISAGGLPDGSITTDDIAAGAVTDAKITGAITDAKLSGVTCKAWVYFTGTGTIAIQGNYNVSSITDNGTGNYIVNFTTAMVDQYYSVSATSGVYNAIELRTATLNTDNVTVSTGLPRSTRYDSDIVTVAVFR